MALWAAQGWITQYPELRHSSGTHEQSWSVRVQAGAIRWEWERSVERDASWPSAPPGWEFEWVETNPRIPMLGGIPLLGNYFSMKDDWYGNTPMTVYVQGSRQDYMTTHVRMKLWFLAAILSPFALWGMFMVWRERQAARRGRCATCGYSRAGLAQDTLCPECGSGNARGNSRTPDAVSQHPVENAATKSR